MSTIEIIPLVGGIGNQLFIVSYALFKKITTEEPVRVAIAKIGPWNRTHSQAVLEDLALDYPLEVTEDSWLQTLRIKSERFLIRNTPANLPLPFNRLGHMQEGEYLNQRLSKASHVPPTQVRNSGYFQTPTALAYLQDLGLMRTLRPAKPSSWYQEKVAEIESDGGVGVHVRRGDFLEASGPGALAVDFYISALREAAEIRPIKHISVFSDDIEMVKKEFEPWKSSFSFIFVSPPEGSSSLESLSVLSQYPSLIISNSTFGWWAAATGFSGKHVISPTSWFKDGRSAPSLNLSEWSLHQPKWL